MPPGLEELSFYDPTDRGFEAELRQRLEALRKKFSSGRPQP
jgi:replication-associated recombination protein RarA